jgi:catechol 2,3-dioxygenase-like lactoylglutathione lyase family enzyme
MRGGRLRPFKGAQKELQMKRFHVHVGVEDLERSIRFYSGLFGAEPTVRKPDYAKWMIEDPRLNFAISRRGAIGVNHLGLQVDSAAELAGIRTQFAAADSGVQDEPGASCCYAKSDKHWVTDPQGIAWEGYHSMGEIRYFGGETEAATASAECCGKEQAAGADRDSRQAPGCCAPRDVVGTCCTPL